LAKSFGLIPIASTFSWVSSSRDALPGRARAQTKEMKGLAMAGDVDKAIQENVQFTFELADKITFRPSAAFRHWAAVGGSSMMTRREPTALPRQRKKLNIGK
jgi:hypothetical protein